MSTSNDDDDNKKHRRKLLLLALLGGTAVVAGSVTLVAATQGGTDHATVVADAVATEDPQIRPGGLEGDDLGDLSAITGDEADVTDTEIVDYLIPEGPAPIQTTWPFPSLIPAPAASGDDTTQPEPGGSNTVPGASPAPGTSPDPDLDPVGDPKPNPEQPQIPTAPEDPTTGGESVEKAQGIPFAIRHDAYSVLMHVTGDFDLASATWSLSRGSLPDGMSVDADTGTISGVPTSEPGDYVFQLEVSNTTRTIQGWFRLVLRPATSTTDPQPGDGTEDPDLPPGGGMDPGEGGNPTPGGGAGEEETPGGTPGTDPGTDPTPGDGGTGPGGEPGDGDDGTAPGEPGTEPTDPATPVDPTDPGAGETPGEEEPGVDPEAPEPGEPTDPTPGGDTEVEPEDPTIDPGAGGAKPDVLTFTVPSSMAIEIGTVVDVDLSATSSMNLPISYEATGLPSWLTFANGRLAGTAPTSAGSFSITLTAANEKNSSTLRSTIIVNPHRIEMETPKLDLRVGEAGSVELSASNGSSNANLVYELRGTPSEHVALEGATLTAQFPTAGTYTATILVTDTNAPGGSRREFSLVIEVAPLPVAIEDVVFSATQYLAFSGKLSATEGWGGYRYVIVEGALPAGVQLTGSELSGAPRSTGSFRILVEATDAKGWTARAEVIFEIKPNPAITPTGSVEVGESPIGGAFSPDGATLYVPTRRAVSIVDVASSTVVGQIPLTGSSSIAIRVSPDGGRLAVVGDSLVQVFDTVSLQKLGEWKSTAISDAIWSSAGDSIYIMRAATSQYAQFITIDTTTWTTTSTLRVGTTGTYWRIQLLQNGKVLANSSGSSITYEIDPTSQTLRAIYAARAATILLKGADETAWMLNGALVQNVDPVTGVLLSSTNLGSGISAGSAALSEDGRWMYIHANGQLLVFDTADLEVIAKVPVNTASSGRVTVAPNGNVYVTPGVGFSNVIVLTPARD